MNCHNRTVVERKDISAFVGLAFLTFAVFLIGLSLVLAQENSRARSISQEQSDIRWMLRHDLKIKDPSTASKQVISASQIVLSRQQAALSVLTKRGGNTLQKQIDQSIADELLKLERAGMTLQQFADANGVRPSSIERSWRWKFAWNAYLKSTLTQENLRRYFESHAARYGARHFRIQQLVIPQARMSHDDVVDAFRMTMEAVDTPDEVAQQFKLIRKKLLPDSTPTKSIWVRGSGDLPSVLFKKLATRNDEGIMDPILSPLGTHIIWVQEVVHQEISFDSLEDRSVLVRDASDALFESLISAGSRDRDSDAANE